jgi:CheY-like chemotaxis protein
MQTLRIVIIDNDEDEQFFIRKGFLSTGLFEITAIFNNGSDLIKQLHQLPEMPDVILSDLNMPGKNGFEILGDLKSDQTTFAIPVIITSNATTPEIIEHCKRLGAFDLRAKPDNFLNYEKFASDLHRDILALLSR